ncbi:TetR/AcrR family transcriptional regulator [Pseudonocardia sp. RS11V-5]|uniref:TetR/AcrR family transcriptional regulator n=1 Tax=Pseudonocardia terrae TaxID=2905831 RepID=UPI001E4B286C|nr:TetR/AcrR family transcriptional regulator [Pseudonocardia terrae]MCE3553714.1 TetR/AcrR family transcriptional regulator [Pseudonocardia terrae]
MTGSALSVTGSTGAESREDRLLDAAADLLVRWGYQRVTIDEVARRAGIGKGTVYLHFRTKEALFLAVLMRSHRTVTAGMADRMEADPAEALPARAVRSIYRELLDDPVTRPLYLGDPEVLGRLAHEAAEALGGLTARRTEVGRRWFSLVREAGRMPTDLPIDAQMHLFSAVTTGFFFLDGMPSTPGPTDPDARADLLEHALRSALEIPGAPLTRECAAECAALFRSLLDDMPTLSETR